MYLPIYFFQFIFLINGLRVLRLEIYFIKNIIMNVITIEETKATKATTKSSERMTISAVNSLL